MTRSKRVLLGVVPAIAACGVFAVLRVFAAPPGSVYTPGETLTPTCAPGDTNCTVTAPMAAVTPGDSGNVLTSNGSAWTSAAPVGGGDTVVLSGTSMYADQGSPSVDYLVAPCAGTISKIWSTLDMSFSGGDVTLTTAINGTPVTNGMITITQSGSAAGDVDSATPTAANTVAAGNLITVTSGGAGTFGNKIYPYVVVACQ